MRILAVSAALAVLAAPAIGVASSASAANGADFKAGYIIDDSRFFDANAMTVDQIQAFLVSKGPRCAAGATCLRSYVETTRTIGATPMCSQYDGGSAESAALIIWKVQRTCGISAKVILVTLQKEQGLVTSSAPSAYAYRSAMGAGCPDTAACDSNYYGFFNQVHYGAFLLKRYTQPPGTGPGTAYDTRFDLRYPVGRVSSILTSPDRVNCASQSVFVANQATHALYIYTPYTPNAAALANVYGGGGNCSSFGNRNFWRDYTDWFGPTTGNDQPVGSLESVQNTPSGVVVRGWALDPNTSDSISVKVSVDGGAAQTVTASQSRNDVAAVFPGSGAAHGFSTTISPADGDHSICVVGVNAGAGADSLIGCATLAVHTSTPWGSVDTLSPDALGTRLSGWAIDPNTSDPLWMHIYVDGKFFTGVRADGPRGDVGAAFPAYGANHGFSTVLPLGAGSHSVCVYALNVGAGNNGQLACSTIQVPTPYAIGSLDAASGDARSITVSGWALDPTSTSPVGLHVYVDGRYSFGMSASGDRPDVGAAYPSAGAAHGFTGSTPAAGGTHSVCVYAFNTAADKVTGLACRDVVVGQRQPIGNVDSMTGSNGAAVLSGWAFDPTVPTQTTWVRVYVDGRFAAGLPAEDPRGDLSAVFPAAGPLHGFAGSVTIGSGQHSVCVYSMAADSSTAGGLACRTVTG